MIRFYQKYLSGLKRQYHCIYIPTCSQYGIEAIEKYGVLKGGLLISAILGITERTTMDMDTTVRGIQMEEDEIVAAVSKLFQRMSTTAFHLNMKNRTDSRGGCL